MLYPVSFEKKIKFDALRDLLSGYCESSMGRDLVQSMSFSSNRNEIEERLFECGELVTILQNEEFPGGVYADVRPSLEKIRIEGLFLEVAEMVALKGSLESIYAILRFFKGKSELYPILSAKAGDVLQFPYIIGRLESIVSKYGTIKDSASQELAQIRRSIHQKQSGISRRMQALLQLAQSEGWADKESGVAVRDGRMVIPVPSAFKRKIKGIIHDESATGKTSYIEPAEIVETNNEIRELEMDEKREIMRILRAFADDLRPYIDDLIPGYDFLAHIDFLKAKAKFSMQLGGVVPKISDNSELMWFSAKHPLLYLSLKQAGKELVPLNLELNEEQRIVVISGPNAGGKSVCLQTAGLLQYMFQCGVMVPVADDSIFGIFDNILIDIGDEQSIENDLSTYSSHLINMKNFLKYGDSRSLILIDEFGTGTEPLLGGAIAEAVLKRLNTQGVKGVITTHYTNLKLVAAETDGITNGAMLYDSARMAPLFELRIGKPGSSFAFEIARKIGLPKDILDEASLKIGEEQVNYDRHLKDIARDKRYWEEKRKKIHENEKRLDQVMERYSSELDQAEHERKQIIREARAEAERIMADANRVIENTIKGIRESQAEKEKTRELRLRMDIEKERLLNGDNSEAELAIQRKIEQLQRRKERREQKKAQVAGGGLAPKNDVEAKPAEQPLKVGDWVRLPNGTAAEIVRFSGKEVQVAIGEIRSMVKLASVKRLSKSEAKSAMMSVPQHRKSSSVSAMSDERFNFKPEIDVRGMRVEEAITEVTHFIDNALVLGYKDLRILHGTGTGALRVMLRQWLNCNPLIAKAHDEHVTLGGAGVTVVQLDI
ncbi:MAG: Smr/MutS family protein [Marinifilaceae bacterium]|nr:Smr/MutS family protein [Marinifilaceae bacterium]